MTIFRKWIVYQDADETTKQTISWSARMMEGDTIASVNNTASGVTVSTPTNTTTSNSYFASGVSGTSGYVTTEIVTTNGETLQATKYFHEIIG